MDWKGFVGLRGIDGCHGYGPLFVRSDMFIIKPCSNTVNNNLGVTYRPSDLRLFTKERYRTKSKYVVDK